MDLYGPLFRKLLLPGWESILRRRPTLALLGYLEQTQWCSADELLAIQTGELRRLLRHAFLNVPFYRARFEAAAVGADDVRGPEDLHRLPLLSREQAQAAGDARRSAAPPWAELRKSTSGTLGRPLAFAYDRGSEYWRQAVKLRGYAWAGYPPGARSLHYWGAQLWPPPPRAQRWKMTADRLLRREQYVDCTLRGPAELARVVEIIRRQRPHVILCYTQAGADLARYIVERGLRDWGTIPVLCGAERLFEADRKLLEQAFGPAVYETYGCREVMLIGTECEAHDGLHIAIENLVVEVVVTENGGTRPARPGEVGEVVLTDLHNYGMPFIRYANGDLAVAGNNELCACGRALPRLRAIEGRVTETLRGADGGRVSGLIFNVIFAGELAEKVRQFQVVQHHDGAVTLRLVPADHFDDDARAHIVRNCQQHLAGVPVRTEVVQEIPVGRSGKRQVVVVERG